MKLVPPITRVDTAKSHWYKDAAGTRVRGVTTILDKGMPKPALINWAANATADGTLDAWDALTKMTPAKRLEAMKKIRYAVKDEASGRGTEIHRYGEALIKGETVNPPEELLGYVEGYARCIDEFNITPVHVEVGVASYRYGYAGTGDLIADVTIPRIGTQRLWIDLKSNRSGIFGETALQLAAYRYADVILGPPEQPMPEVDGCAAIHITPTGSHLIPVTAGPEQFLTFRYCQQVALFEDISRDLVGAAITPATDSAYRLVREGDE